MSADLRVASPKPGAVKPGFPAALTSFRLGDKVIPALTFLICLATIVYGSLMLTDNLLEIYALPLLGGICIILQLFFMDVYRQKKTLDFKLVSLSALNFLFILALLWLPRYFSGWQLNTVIHRSFFAAIFMLAGGITAMSVSIYYLLGATPQAEDASRYPYLLLPVILVLIVYLALIGQLLGSGLRYFNWDILQKAYYSYNWPVKTTIGNGWPAWTSRMQFQYGIANHIKGTGLLMLLTSLILGHGMW